MSFKSRIDQDTAQNLAANTIPFGLFKWNNSIFVHTLQTCAYTTEYGMLGEGL